nr:hypothetical protein [Burkholderiales bacterium]
RPASLEGIDEAWLSDYRSRLASEGMEESARIAKMHAVNPKYVLRNHLAQEAIEKAEYGDYSEIGRLMDILSRPYEEQPGMDRYSEPPSRDMLAIEVSCSS